MDTITREELQEMQDMLDGKLLLGDEELLYWMKKDLQKLLTAYTAVMYRVTIPEGRQAEGAVAALVKIAKVYAAWTAGNGAETGRKKLYDDLQAALAHFEVGPDTGARGSDV